MGKIIAVIPARGGSKGVSRKNIRLLGDKPLIAYSIEVAKECKLIDRVIVTTDDEEIAEISRKYGAEIPYIRPEELAQDDTPAFPVLKHLLDYLLDKEDYKPDIIVWLEPPFPFRKVKEIEEAIQIFKDDKNADSLRSVCEPFQNPFKMWTLKDSYLNPLIGQEKAMHSGPRQKTMKTYWQNGHAFIMRYNTIMKKGNFHGDNILPYILEQNRFIDIDSEDDLKLAEYFLKDYVK